MEKGNGNTKTKYTKMKYLCHTYDEKSMRKFNSIQYDIS